MQRDEDKGQKSRRVDRRCTLRCTSLKEQQQGCPAELRHHL